MADRELHELLDQAINAVLAGAPPDVQGADLEALVRMARALAATIVRYCG